MKSTMAMAGAWILSAGLLAAQDAPPPQPPPAPPPAQAPAPSPEQGAAVAPATLTVGDFAMKVATHLHLSVPAGGYTPESAAWALLQKGVRLRPELGAPLVEGDVVEILTGLGYRIRTTTPSRVMTRDRMDAITSVFFPGTPVS